MESSILYKSSGPCSWCLWESPLNGRLIHCWLAPSRCWYSFTYPRKMESRVSLSRKKGHKYLILKIAVDRTRDRIKLVKYDLNVLTRLDFWFNCWGQIGTKIRSFPLSVLFLTYLVSKDCGKWSKIETTFDLVTITSSVTVRWLY